MTEVDQQSVMEMIQRMGPTVRNEVHLRLILNKLEPDQQRLVYDAIKPYLKFKPRKFAKLMPKSVN